MSGLSKESAERLVESLRSNMEKPLELIGAMVEAGEWLDAASWFEALEDAFRMSAAACVAISVMQEMGETET